MRKITKDEAPEFWTQFVKRNPKVTYAKLEKVRGGSQIKRDIRDYMVVQQQYLCAYCCSCIDSATAHNEHICPQAKCSRMSMDYYNLLASCTTKGGERTCGMYKEDDYDSTLFVSPLADDCERHFRFLDNGMIEGTTPQGKYTVNLLNLNTYKLREARKATLIGMDSFFECCGKEEVIQNYMTAKDGKLPRFVDMANYFVQQGRFDTIAE